MGTKRSLASIVRSKVEELNPDGLTADLFSGMGSVADSLSSEFPVLANDLFQFTSAFARARFTDLQMSSVQDLIGRLTPLYLTCHERISEIYRDQLRLENEALEAGREHLLQLIVSAPHVGVTDEYKLRAIEAQQTDDKLLDHYQLTCLYFATGYFSLKQAIELDSIRFAIEESTRTSAMEDRDWLLSAWISAASLIISAPGHTAQFLKPTSDRLFSKFKHQWRRSAWSMFLQQLETFSVCGTLDWRTQNRITTTDALTFFDRSDEAGAVGLVYADPPYTEDQYSRYYHVFETLFLYDYPDSHGIGRYRSDRFRTEFSLASAVESAFDQLFFSISQAQVPLILSYPNSGLLIKKGIDVPLMLSEYFTVREIVETSVQHSTLGASKGTSKIQALERIYVCTT